MKASWFFSTIPHGPGPLKLSFHSAVLNYPCIIRWQFSYSWLAHCQSQNSPATPWKPWSTQLNPVGAFTSSSPRFLSHSATSLILSHMYDVSQPQLRLRPSQAVALRNVMQPWGTKLPSWTSKNFLCLGSKYPTKLWVLPSTIWLLRHFCLFYHVIPHILLLIPLSNKDFYHQNYGV